MSRHRTTTRTAESRERARPRGQREQRTATRRWAGRGAAAAAGPRWGARGRAPSKAAGRPPKDTATALPGTCPREGEARARTASGGRRPRPRRPPLRDETGGGGYIHTGGCARQERRTSSGQGPRHACIAGRSGCMRRRTQQTHPAGAGNTNTRKDQRGSQDQRAERWLPRADGGQGGGRAEKADGGNSSRDEGVV